MMMRGWMIAVLLLPCIVQAFHSLKSGDLVPLSMNKLWPADNPSETYEYYSLPFCEPEKLEMRHMTLGQIIRGDRLMNSLYNIRYQEDDENTTACTRSMPIPDLNRLRYAISNRYMFEMYVDELPVVKLVGNLVDGRYLLNNNWHFVLGDNEGTVVSADLSFTRNQMDITDDSITQVSFNYTTVWTASSIPRSEKIQMQLKSYIMSSEEDASVHWLSLGNSFAMLVAVMGLVTVTLGRAVKRDIAGGTDVEIETEPEGWKQLSHDVFRPPAHRMWFSACVGSGAHLFFVLISVLLFILLMRYINTGTLVGAMLITYLTTSYISGYISADLYCRLGGVKWAWNVVVTVLLFSLPCLILWAFVNTVAISYDSTAALPFTTGLALFLLWLFVTIPLTVIGALRGRRHALAIPKDKLFPCKTNKLAREIPAVYWYEDPLVQLGLSGILAFSVIYMELRSIFASVWGFSTAYSLLGVFVVALLILLGVCSLLSILLTYIHLNNEDYYWWWNSIGIGPATAFFFFLYCIDYYVSSTRMSGFLQVSVFFAYSLMITYALALLLSFSSFIATFTFVKFLYSNVKLD